jgi:hypothetical protein
MKTCQRDSQNRVFHQWGVLYYLPFDRYRRAELPKTCPFGSLWKKQGEASKVAAK